MRWLPILVVLLTTPASRACIWDFDTMRDERRGLPDAADIVAGRWERHSPFFYRDRIVRMRARLAADPTDADAFDNLAVAYEKLDDRDAAIATMLKKEKVRPGQYTTFANLGTFYIHKGEFTPGIESLRKALAINPDAHFGREEYQLRLAEYLRDGQRDPAVLTRSDFLGATDFSQYGYDGQRYWRSTDDPEPVRFKPNLMDGIVGMIRFGTGRSAELYLVLGELLERRDLRLHLGLHLAYRAYLRAIELGHPRSAAIRAHLDERFVSWREIDPAGYAQETMASERLDADRWVRAYQDFEDARIRAGQDPIEEAALATFYAAHPRRPAGHHLTDLRSWWAVQTYSGNLLWTLLVLVVLPVGLWKVWYDRRRKRRRLTAPSAS